MFQLSDYMCSVLELSWPELEVLLELRGRCGMVEGAVGGEGAESQLLALLATSIQAPAGKKEGRFAL